MADLESFFADDSFAQSDAQDAASGTRRSLNGTIGSVYSGNRIKHLKKEDGIPLWRKDIQYEFLKLVFDDRTPAFTRSSDGRKNMEFADVYIDAMARSSKTSKVLKDKLLNDRPAAVNMAMVCLLVNFGRMNTTLNFFPEMRAQLRTYHSIPSLQAHQQDSTAYKQLQDAPRLKSILKGASEDSDQPNTLEKIKLLPVPRTNPVNLIFVLSQYAPKVSEVHFFPPRDFFDLVMRATLSSRSRARAFLWLMWWYLESDFTREAALNNPFGPGLDGDGTEDLPIKVPIFEHLTEEQANEENIDTLSELEYGEMKQAERRRILEEEDPALKVPKRPKKDAGYEEDMASVEPQVTPLPLSSKRPASDEDDSQALSRAAQGPSKRPKRDSSFNCSVGQQRLILKTKAEQTPDQMTSAPQGSGHIFANRSAADPSASHGSSSRRPRPLTQHQLAVEQNRRQRIDYLIAKRKAEIFKGLREKRERVLDPIISYALLLQGVPDGYSTEDEEDSWGQAGLLQNPRKREDYGECANYFVSVIRKATRRLDRWDFEEANGPKSERKRAREQRHQEKQERLAAATAADVTPSRGSARRPARPAPPRKDRRKPAGGAKDTTEKPSGGATSSRSKGSRSVSNRAAATASSSTLSASRLRHVSPLRPLSQALADDEVDKVALDEIDKELLGEVSGDDDQDQPPHARPGRVGYNDSYVGGDDDGEPLSSDDEGDEDELDEGEGDENSSRYESSSVLGEGVNESRARFVGED